MCAFLVCTSKLGFFISDVYCCGNARDNAVDIPEYGLQLPV